MKTLFIFSDSVAVGQYVAVHLTWAHLLSAQLYPRWCLQNASKNGETTRGALERLQPEVLHHHPDLVYIQFGSNDANKWQTDKGAPRVSLEAYRANLYEMVARCNHYGAEVVLGMNHISYVKGLERYNDVVMEVAKDCGLTLVDHTMYDGDFLMVDRVHLNEYGHRLYFESVSGAIP